MRKILLVVLLLSGCGLSGRQMSNDEIIRETWKCRDAEMDAREVRGWTGETVYIECVPRER